MTQQLVHNADVKCAYNEMVDPTTLKPHPLNPNEHSATQIDLFVAILQYQGWRRPITVSRRSGFITKGHGALEAALSAGFTEVPVDYQAYATEEEELADLTADNQLARMSTMNVGKLKQVMTTINTGTFDMKMTGFDESSLEKLIGVKMTPQLKIGEEPSGLVGAPVQPGGPEPEGTLPGTPAPSSQVRMVQLFLNEETQAELMRIVDFFQKELGTDNVTDTVLEILRSAYEGHTAETGE